MEQTNGVSCNCLLTTIITLLVPYFVYKFCKNIYYSKFSGSLKGKVVVITGASGGLGEALAHEYYQHGCKLVLCARRKAELERVKQDLLKTSSNNHGLEPIIVSLDLSDFKSLPGHAKTILEAVGHVDVLINNGGVTNRGTVLDTLLDVDINIMNVNYFGTVCFTKALLPSMVQRKSGHIVNVSSIQGLVSLPKRSSYCASKHALQAFSDTLRAEVAQHNINVTIVSPGYIRTQLSMNALTASGGKHMKMDAGTDAGYDAAYIAHEMCKSVRNKDNELVITQFYIWVIIYLRKYLPGVYFYLMGMRARQNDP